MDALVAAMAEQLKQRVDEVRAYKVFGWQEDSSFLLGDHRIVEDKVQRVKVTGDSASSFLHAFSRNDGNAKEWADIVEMMYAHPGHAPFQTVVLFGIGSPLLRFYQMPTGCLVNLVGDKGTGKTTVAHVAISAYGDPNVLMTELRSTTELALYNRLATLHSIPCSVDEMTNVDGAKASMMIYSIMNGRPRDGLRSDGKRRDQLLPWQTVTFAASNDSIIELLSTHKGDASAEMSRLIELDWPHASTILRREMDALLDKLRGHYGAMGMEFVKWVNQNEAMAKRTLFTVREMIETELKIDKENRFWSAHVAVPIATKMILQEMGLLNKFDLDEVLNFCLSTVREHGTAIVNLTMTPIEAFHAMLTELSSRIIITRTMKDSRLATPDHVDMRDTPCGRAILEENTLYLSVREIREWCNENRVRYKALRNDAVSAGMLVDETRVYFGRGTNRVTGQAYSWQLDLAKVLDQTQTAAEPTPSGHLRLIKS